MACGAKCGEDIVNSKDVIKCSDCKTLYHLKCCRVRTAAKFAKMSAEVVKTWRCDPCKGETQSAASLSDSENSAIFEVLKNIQKDVSANRQETRDGIAALNTSITTLTGKIEGLQARVGELEADNLSLKSECSALGNQIYNLQCELADVQQYTRNQNIEIRGIPRTRDEDIYKVLQAVARALGVNYDRDMFSTAHRLQALKDPKQHPAIVAQFISRTKRAEWLEAARKKHIKTTDLAPSLPEAPVFVNEHLTAANKIILGRAKFLVKKKKLVSAWVRDGKIKVRKTSESQIKRVWTMSEVDKIADVEEGWSG